MTEDAHRVSLGMHDRNIAFFGPTISIFDFDFADEPCSSESRPCTQYRSLRVNPLGPCSVGGRM